MKLHENFPLLCQLIKVLKPKTFRSSLKFTIFRKIIEAEFRIQQQKFQREYIYNIGKFLKLEKKIIRMKKLMAEFVNYLIILNNCCQDGIIDLQMVQNINERIQDLKLLYINLIKELIFNSQVQKIHLIFNNFFLFSS